METKKLQNCMELRSWYKMDRAIGQFQIINNCEAKGNEKKKEMYQSFMNLSAFSFVLYP